MGVFSVVMKVIEGIRTLGRERKARQSGGLSSREWVKPPEGGGADRLTAKLAAESLRAHQGSLNRKGLL